MNERLTDSGATVVLARAAGLPESGVHSPLGLARKRLHSKHVRFDPLLATEEVSCG